MKQPFLYTIIAALASLLFIGSEALAQGDTPRFEIGGQFSLLTLNKPSSQSDEFVSGHADPGFGAKFTYNVTDEIAFEAEGNFFPGRNFDSEGSFFSRPNNDNGVPSGQIYQGQFGVKAGKRFKKVGLFGKIRPGFVRFTKVSQFTGFREVTFIHPFYGEVRYENAEFRIGKATYLSTDVGGVVEFYPSRRIVTRLDIGDTIIRYGIYREPLGVVCPLAAPACPTQVFERPAETRHNLQFSAGIGIRF
jgi:Outer membrane protein beta-barrel domain